jgi:hypothetical protein
MMRLTHKGRGRKDLKALTEEWKHLKFSFNPQPISLGLDTDLKV